MVTLPPSSIFLAVPKNFLGGCRAPGSRPPDSVLPDEGTDLMDAVKAIFALRKRLIPYLSEQMKRSGENDMPLITPVFLRDANYDRESDCFMCGDRILVCPVFDEGVTELTVRLPGSDIGFRLRGEGEPIDGGTSVRVSCTAFDLPVWFTEG